VSRPGWCLQRLDDVPGGDEWLTHRERTVQAGLVVAKRRADWRLGRFTAKRLVASTLACDVDAIEVVATDEGAPAVLVGGRPSRARLSISHRDGRSVATLSTDATAVGCDLELAEPRSEAFVREWLDDRERAALAVNPLPPSLVVNLLWTGKEAAAKALGGGLRLDVRGFVVCPGQGEPVDGWRPLRVECSSEGRVLTGWWREEGDDVLTIVADPPPDLPRRVEL